MEEKPERFQEEHLNFLTYNEETQEILKIFPQKYPSDSVERKELVTFLKRLK